MRVSKYADLQVPRQWFVGHDQTTSAQAIAWGWLPRLSLVAATGLLLISVAMTGARIGATGADRWSLGLFWLGLLGFYLPIAGRLVAFEVKRRERIGLLVVLGLSLYCVKILHSPTLFKFTDETSHWRTANDMLLTGRLFNENPLLPVSPFYPGIELVTTALSSLTGLSIFAAGVIMLALARLILVLALFLLFEQLTRSARLGSIAVLIYLCQPNMLIFDAQFAYESLALPMAAVVVYATARRNQCLGRDRATLTLVALFALAAVIPTHHVTSYALLAFLLLWSGVSLWRKRDQEQPMGPGGITMLALIGTLAWTAYVASLTVAYLAPQFQGVAIEFYRLVAGEGSSRQLFRSHAGRVSPLLERLTGFGSVGLIMLALPFGLLEIWRRHRQRAVALTFGIAALAYPASLAIRFTVRGAELSNRASPFVFLALAFALALAVAACVRTRVPERFQVGLATAWVGVLFAGGVIVGWPLFDRIPGPYLVTADSRSVEAQSLAAARWMQEVVGPGQRIIADRTNRQLLGSYGEQRPVTSYADKVRTAFVFFGQTLGPSELDLLQRGNVRYVVVDRRLSTGLPSVGSYFERGEPGTFAHNRPLDPALLAKFDTVPGVSRIFDSGALIVYDVGNLVGTTSAQ